MKTPIHGVLPDFQIKALIESGTLIGATESCIQPASIDLMPDLNTLMSLSHYTLPRGGERIDEMIMQLRHAGIAKDMRALDLLPQCHYLVRMKESVSSMRYFMRANPKSSIGRIFMHSRLLANGMGTVDEVPKDYSGELWMLLTPKMFPVVLSEKESVNQLRFFSGDARLSEHEVRRMIGYKSTIVTLPHDLFDNGHVPVVGNTIGEIPISVDLQGKCYRTRLTNRPLSLDERNIPFDEYYELIGSEEMKNGLIIEQGRGYLIGTLEQFQVPANMAVEVVVSDKYGEIKLHFAGFVDPGFGLDIGNSITLEIVANEHGYCLRHGQHVGTVRCEWMTDVPLNIYTGNYSHQERGAKLPKYLYEDPRKVRVM